MTLASALISGLIIKMKSLFEFIVCLFVYLKTQFPSVGESHPYIIGCLSVCFVCYLCVTLLSF